MIKNGTTVTWSYQAGGIEFSQTGKILSFVEAQVPANGTLHQMGIEATTRQKKFADTSSNDRYLIVVDNDGVPNYYAPMVSVVEKQNPQAVKPVKVSPKVEAAPVQVTAPQESTDETVHYQKGKGTPPVGVPFVFGNSTKYKTFAVKSDSEFVGFRVWPTVAKLKMCLVGGDFSWAYHSGVRQALSGYVYPASNDSIVSDLSKQEVKSFVEGIAAYFSDKGYQVDTTALLADLDSKASGTGRRKIKAQFGN